MAHALEYKSFSSEDQEPRNPFVSSHANICAGLKLWTCEQRENTNWNLLICHD
ncbi:hypothetical protein predicted by Glimmer/Critica [Bdellovibrio bacteriovorus HD100]|uniref:Uncharacterized protein n=1 Tax=Bdellovibrio bacteriovorus (strain ATCC 15356 / DSM 50701 / NCIMB 9529 / HD100) TaxID=264462 RepID=Q6MLU0_BDEBA|nr:hypothetical protein predicted by Glimmer/Critica [Bdellovibrio bacteriovorus HD100]